MYRYLTRCISLEEAIDGMLRIYSTIPETVLLTGVLLKYWSNVRQRDLTIHYDWFADAYAAAVLDIASTGGMHPPRKMPVVDETADGFTVYWGHGSKNCVELAVTGQVAQIEISHVCRETIQKWIAASQIDLASWNRIRPEERAGVAQV